MWKPLFLVGTSALLVLLLMTDRNAVVVGGSSQPNTAAATMLVENQSGAVAVPVRGFVTLEISGAPNSFFLVWVGPELNPSQSLSIGDLEVMPTVVPFNGSIDPAFNTGPTGTRTFMFEVPAITELGTSVSIQAAVQDMSSPLGVTLTASSTVTWVTDGIMPQNLFFDPALGSGGVAPIFPAAGTQPGDMPTLGQFGFPGPTAVTNPADNLPVHTVFDNPMFCVTCHGGAPTVWQPWMGTMMANASRDPIFQGAFPIAVADMNFLHANGLTHLEGDAAADLCLRCHMPTAWYGGRSGFKGDGITTPFEPDVVDAALGIDMEGVVCEVCHRARDFSPTIAPGFSQDPNRPENGQLVLSHTRTRHGPFPGTVTTSYAGTTPYGALVGPAVETAEPNVPNNMPLGGGTAVSPAHGTEQHPFITDAAMCGSCHNVTNPLTGLAEQRTYTEWQDSDFADPSSPEFASCTTCHMQSTSGIGQACTIPGSSPTYGQFAKPRIDLPSHMIVGANAWVPQLLKVLYPNVDAPWQTAATNYNGVNFPVPASRDLLWDQTTAAVGVMMAQAAQVDLTASEPQPDMIQATVSIENRSGHKLPTGYPEGRKMWIQLRVLDANDNPVYETGLLDSDGELIRDADVKVYELLQGIDYPTLAIPPQESFHFILNNYTLKDNRIHAKGMTQRKGAGGTDSFDPVLAPWPEGGLYPDNHYIDTTTYTVNVPPGTPRPLKITASVLHQSHSLEYVDFLANGGDATNSTMPVPIAGTVLNLWNSGMRATPTPVGVIGPTSTVDPTSPFTTAMVTVN